MAAPSHGYEPDRLTTLDGKTTAAVTSLRSITSTDPAASEAIAAVRNLQSTLETGWAPAIRSIQQSTALSGGVPIHAFGGGGSSGSWDKSTDGPEPGTFTFEPFNALSALFPGDDDITAEEIVAKINEILERDPSEQQLIELGVLGNALEEIANDEKLSEEVLLELGPGGIEDVYTRMFVLGSQYPINPTVGTAHFDEDRKVGLNLDDVILDPFNAVVAAGAQRPGGAAVVSEVIERGKDQTYDFDLAAIQGLSRIGGLPIDLQHELLDTLLVIDDEGVERGPWGSENVLFPGHRSADDALQSVITHIIEMTPEGELIERLPDGSSAGTGVIFDLAAILAERGIDVRDLALLTVIAPYLPDLSGAIPLAGSSISPQQYRALLKNLLEDLSPEQVDAALAILSRAAIDRITDVVSAARFTPGESAAHNLRGLLDGVFGPVVGALDDILGDRETAAALLAQVLSTIAGLAPSPESKVAATAISTGVSYIIGRLTKVTDSTDVAMRNAKIELVASAINEVYQDDELREQVGRTALEQWDTVTKADLEEFDLNDDEVARIKRELERSARTGEPLPADVFVKLPDVVELAETLERELTLSPAEAASRD